MTNDTQSTEALRQTVRDLSTCESYSQDELLEAVHRTGWITRADDEQFQQVFEYLAKLELHDKDSNQPHIVLSIVAQSLQRFRLMRSATPDFSVDPELVELITAVYRQLETPAKARALLLALLGTIGGKTALNRYVDLMVTTPPGDDQGIELAVEPLMKEKEVSASLFPRLLQGIEHASVAPTILDLANFLVRENVVEQHPATSSRERLVTLLNGLVDRLTMILDQSKTRQNSLEKINRQVAQSVALGVGLCDALALIGDPASADVLLRVLELPHRRLRTEAAAALTRLGIPSGKAALLELLREPVTRLRVLVYADELGIQDDIDPQYCTEVARAESELAMWLELPDQMGVAPTSLELFDQRPLYWPGFDELIDCFLFRFEYRMGDRAYSNIGIAGPVCFAFASDMADLPPQDIYAAFAGWHVSHDEVYEFDIRDEVTEGLQADVARYSRRIGDQGLADIRPVTLGVFFGERVLIAAAQKEGVEGVALADDTDIAWYPQAPGKNPLGPDEVYAIYKGKKLLRSFNE